MAMAGQVSLAKDLGSGDYRRTIARTIQLSWARISAMLARIYLRRCPAASPALKAGQLSAEGLRYVATGYVGRLSRAMPDVPKLPQCSSLRM